MTSGMHFQLKLTLKQNKNPPLFGKNGKLKKIIALNWLGLQLSSIHHFIRKRLFFFNFGMYLCISDNQIQKISAKVWRQICNDRDGKQCNDRDIEKLI